MNGYVRYSVAIGTLTLAAMMPSASGASPSQDRELAMDAYERGDHGEAFRLALTAARANVPDAQSFVAFLYGHGVGTVKDAANAMFWLQKSVDNKHPYAYNLMSIAYLQGDWVEKDIQKSYEFAKLANRSGYDTTKSFVGTSLISEISRVAGPDSFNCMSYGFRQGTPSFSQCLMQTAQTQQLARRPYGLLTKNQLCRDMKKSRKTASPSYSFYLAELSTRGLTEKQCAVQWGKILLAVGAVAVVAAVVSEGGGGGSYGAANTEDVTFRWDEQPEQFGQGRRWVCRGEQTGQYAEISRCAGTLKADYRWPG